MIQHYRWRTLFQLMFIELVWQEGSLVLVQQLDCLIQLLIFVFFLLQMQLVVRLAEMDCFKGDLVI